MTSTRLRTGTIGLVLILGFVAQGFVTPTAASAITADASVSLTANVEPSGYGQTVTFKTVVNDPGTPRAQITGSMTFLDGTGALGTKTVVNGTASFGTRTLSAGAHTITATFSPADGTAAIGSAPLTQHVNPGTTTTTLSTTRAISYNGQTGNVVATVKPVAPALGPATGSVDFSVDGSWYWTSSLDAKGKASFPYTALTPGTYSITADFTGDANLQPSSSLAPLTQTILPAAPTAGLSFTPTTVTQGGVSRLVVTAKNDLPVAMPNVAMGVLLPGLPTAIVSQPPGVGCRRALGNLLYCMVSLPAGATRKLVLDVTGSVPGTFQASSYARNIDTDDETGAIATLTVQ